MTCETSLRIYRGDTPTYIFTITDADDQPLNLTGATVHFACKANFEATSFIFDRTCTITNAIGGVCQVQLTIPNTNFVGNDAIAELSVDYAGGIIITVEQFKVDFLQDLR